MGETTPRTRGSQSRVGCSGQSIQKLKLWQTQIHPSTDPTIMDIKKDSSPPTGGNWPDWRRLLTTPTLVKSCTDQPKKFIVWPLFYVKIVASIAKGGSKLKHILSLPTTTTLEKTVPSDPFIHPDLGECYRWISTNVWTGKLSGSFPSVYRSTQSNWDQGDTSRLPPSSTHTNTHEDTWWPHRHVNRHDRQGSG